jgi:hypothetical protein
MGKSDFREDFRRYEEASAELDHQAARTGTKVPDYFTAAKGKASELSKAGVTADDVKT